MSQAPNLLNDDGTASMATMLLMAHHAFRRDIARFIKAVEQIKAGDASRTDALREEWEKSYRAALHGHHTIEDTSIFPDIRQKHPDLASALDILTEQHHKIDPVLDQVKKLLPEILLVKLPAAQKNFEIRSERVWGTYSVGRVTTPIPEEY